MSFVNIVTSDRGWILETLAREIAARLPYVAFGDGPRRDAAIQYYITYSCRRRRLSPIELAFFTHLEPEGAAHDAFFDTARQVDHCVCQSSPYAALLQQAGVEAVSIIPPGVDPETFRPKLRVGVIGRTYHTGRKGEHLVEQLRDLEEIEWVFTGGGWPEPGRPVPAAALPDLYRSLDYVLVPALYEGGPMCVIEALACGTPVIAPPVGWVPDFPHVEYRLGDAEDLRRVLLDCLEQKRARRASVLGHSWDAWAEGHHRLFQSLAAARGIALGPPAARPALPRRVGLLLHGNEREAQGGPSVRAPRLVQELEETGIPAELRHHPAPEGFGGLDLVHVFNSWPNWSAPDAVRRAHRSGNAVVFSPILLDHGLGDLWGGELPRLLAESEPGEGTDAALAAFRARLAARRAAGRPPAEPAAGFHSSLREMAALSDRLIFLSEREKARLAAIGARTAHGRVVRNPVDAARFAEADPALFRAATGLQDFVLCAARLEPRKNQAVLAHALRGTGLPLVLLGHATDAGYRAVLERHLHADVHVLPRLAPDSPLLASAFAAARVFALPSWAEGAPLAALEAAAAGAALVLSDESGEREYFADHARYVDPADPDALRAAVLAAWAEGRAGAAERQDFVARHYGWEAHRAATEAVYAEALEAARLRGASAPAPLPAPTRQRRRAPMPVVFDVTTGANHKGRWTGIARVEAALALALHAGGQAALRFVAWNNTARSFVELPFAAVRDGTLAEALAAQDEAPEPIAPLPEGAPLFVAGSGWMQNSLYVERLVSFARTYSLRLTPLIHDVIPTRFPFWFDEGYAPVFEHNLTLLLDGAEALLAVSEATRAEVEAFAARVPGLLLPPIGVLREGDEIGQIGPDARPEAAAGVPERLEGRGFVLCVGAIHARKNHRLLYDVWLKLVAQMGPRCPLLVLVGGAAWGGRDLARALRQDERLEGRVLILEDVDDAALAWLYGNCLFSVYPSLQEGWGLPVAESLRHGKLCLAADIPSIREIAPGLVELLDPLDVTGWTARIRFLAGSRAAREAAEARIAQGYAPHGWDRAAAQLLGHLAAGAEARRPARPYTLGTVVPFGDRITASRLRWTGWFPFEKWGCWAGETTAALRFEPTEPVRAPLLLLAEIRALPPAGAATYDLKVVVNGQAVASWHVPAGGFQLFHALIPAALAASQSPIGVEFVAAALTSVAEVSAADDPRRLGIGLAQVALAPLSAVTDAVRYFEMERPGQKRQRPGQRHVLLRSAEGRATLEGTWRSSAPWGLWTAEPVKRLAMTILDQPGSDLALNLRIRPVATAEAPLVLRARVNVEEVVRFEIAAPDPVTLAVPLPAPLRARRQPVALELEAEVQRAPRDLGLGQSEIAFGFGLLSIELCAAGVAPDRPRLDLPPGGAIRLGTAEKEEAEVAALSAALGADWHGPEPMATWSCGATAVLPLLLPEAGAEGARLELDLSGYRAPPGSDALPVRISAGGRLLAEQAITPRRPATLVLHVPADCIGADGALDLTCEAAAAASPFMGGEGADERLLGLRLAVIRRA
ncbi:glycosyltransferase family 4 protein [Falsiroseomonas bella]|nr:glycosyltransferase [Falsiroseomonas bella]